ncbi:dehydrogenase [Streptomyces tanashiensis]|uniref:Dehydrogenase n=1 Tax=Streptomyces tanashiensis TaxID=67367 RepID=A0ABY6QZ23_9ACTN|nr:dehydrogenase [Streptomyces tanashiensis]UZX22582.1 dehydrogenase [Streptomyces tanashiensis]GGY59972.1 hypothetical protein GCM10010299_77890 [Streptomyces tanashiensis]
MSTFHVPPITSIAASIPQTCPSDLAMQVAGTPTFLATAEGQGVSPELIGPYFGLMRRRLDAGSGEEDLAGVVDLLRR